MLIGFGPVYAGISEYEDALIEKDGINNRCRLLLLSKYLYVLLLTVLLISMYYLYIKINL